MFLSKPSSDELLEFKNALDRVKTYQRNLEFSDEQMCDLLTYQGIGLGDGKFHLKNYSSSRYTWRLFELLQNFLKNSEHHTNIYKIQKFVRDHENILNSYLKEMNEKLGDQKYYNIEAHSHDDEIKNNLEFTVIVTSHFGYTPTKEQFRVEESKITKEQIVEYINQKNTSDVKYIVREVTYWYH